MRQWQPGRGWAGEEAQDQLEEPTGAPGGLWEAKPWDSEFNPWTKAGQAFSVKGLRVNILSFVGRIQALLPFLLLFIYFFYNPIKTGSHF